MGITAVTAICALFALSAGAEEPEWQETSRGRVAIRQRTLAGSNVTELRAEAFVRAPLQDVEAALLDCAAYPRFMPYVSACAELGPVASDGSRTVYTRLDVPLVANRDYILALSVRRAGADAFQLSWTSRPDALPEVEDVVRLRINHGSWRGSRAEGGTYLVYSLTAEAGAGVSPRFVRLTNPMAVSDLFEAIEEEALRRAHARGAVVPASG